MIKPLYSKSDHHRTNKADSIYRVQRYTSLEDGLKMLQIKYKTLDPMEEVKTFEERYYGPYCAISGDEPSPVTL